MSAALRKCEAVPANDTLATPIVPNLTPLNLRDICDLGRSTYRFRRRRRRAHPAI